MKKLISILTTFLLLSFSFNSFAQERSDQYRLEKETEVADYLNSIKITFLSWLSGSTKVSYERALPDLKQSMEI